jgi:hypothetical protein
MICGLAGRGEHVPSLIKGLEQGFEFTVRRLRSTTSFRAFIATGGDGLPQFRAVESKGLTTFRGAIGRASSDGGGNGEVVIFDAALAWAEASSSRSTDAGVSAAR